MSREERSSKSLISDARGEIHREQGRWSRLNAAWRGGADVRWQCTDAESVQNVANVSEIKFI